MPPSTEEFRPINPDTERRMVAIHGAASAAVGAVNRLSSIIPMNHTGSGVELEDAGHRLAVSMQRLEGAVSGLLIAREKVPEISARVAAAEADKWQKRYHAVERERDSLQGMLVALKEKYERLQGAYAETARAHDRKVLEVEAMQLRNLDAKQRLESSLFLIEALLKTADSIEEGEEL